MVAADWGVGPDDLLGSAIGLGEGGADGDVLADGEAKDGVGGGELEAVDGHVVGNYCLLLEFEFLEDIRLQDLLELCMYQL